MSYVDLEGHEITLARWMELSRVEMVGRILAESVVPNEHGDQRIRTVWTGLVIPEIDVRAFATGDQAAKGDGPWITLEQYDTPAEAMAGHIRWCGRLAGLTP